MQQPANELKLRRRVILQHLADGLRPKEIAAKLNVAYSFVYDDIEALRRIYEARTTYHLMRIVIERKIVTLSEI